MLRPLKFFVSASFENNENGIREIALDFLITINATK